MAILLLIIYVSLFITVSNTQALSIEIPIEIIPKIEIKTASPTASIQPISTPAPIEIVLPEPTTILPIQVQIQEKEKIQEVDIPEGPFKQPSKVIIPKPLFGDSEEPNFEKLAERLRFITEFEGTGDIDKRVAVAGRRIKIATDEGKTKLIDRGVTALVEGNIVFEKRPIKVLPSDIKKKIPGVKKISLIDDDNPKYLVNRELKGKIFGIIPVQNILTDEINAQTGKVTKQDKHWWWKVFVRETGISLDEGEACPLSGPDWCRAQLRCAVVQPGTVVPSDVGECRLYPVAVHGKIFVVTSEGQTVSLHKRVKNLPNVEVFDIKTYFSSHPECGGSQVTEISFDDQGNFLINDLPQGVYDIYSMITFASDRNHPVAHPWIFSVNDGSEVQSINLSGANYNENNQIRILKNGSSLPLLSPLCP